MPNLSAIPDHVIRQVRRSLNQGGGNLDRRSVNMLTNELRELNANLSRLIELEKKKQEEE